MRVVRHYHKGVEDDVGEALRQGRPDCEDHVAASLRHDSPSKDLAKAAHPVESTDGDEVAAELGIVVVREAERGAATRQIIGHQGRVEQQGAPLPFCGRGAGWGQASESHAHPQGQGMRLPGTRRDATTAMEYYHGRHLCVLSLCTVAPV